MYIVLILHIFIGQISKVFLYLGYSLWAKGYELRVSSYAYSGKASKHFFGRLIKKDGSNLFYSRER